MSKSKKAATEHGLPTVPCQWCGKPTTYTSTRECDPCHNVRTVAQNDPDLVHRIAAAFEDKP